jgi:hypothetical protein
MMKLSSVKRWSFWVEFCNFVQWHIFVNCLTCYELQGKKGDYFSPTSSVILSLFLSCLSSKLVRDVLTSRRVLIFDRICLVYFVSWLVRGEETSILGCLDLTQIRLFVQNYSRRTTRREVRYLCNWTLRAKPLNELLTCNRNPICYKVRKRCTSDPLWCRICHVRNTGGWYYLEPCKQITNKNCIYNETWNILFFTANRSNLCLALWRSRDRIRTLNI